MLILSLFCFGQEKIRGYRINPDFPERNNLHKVLLLPELCKGDTFELVFDFRIGKREKFYFNILKSDNEITILDQKRGKITEQSFLIDRESKLKLLFIPQYDRLRDFRYIFEINGTQYRVDFKTYMFNIDLNKMEQDTIFIVPYETCFPNSKQELALFPNESDVVKIKIIDKSGSCKFDTVYSRFEPAQIDFSKFPTGEYRLFFRSELRDIKRNLQILR